MRTLMPIGFLAVAAGFSVAVMLLWNWLIPVIFGLSAISFWQALGILVFCRILFGSFGGGHKRFRPMMSGVGDNPFREKWTKMTPEQRKEFLNKRMEHLDRGGFFGGRNFDSDTNENVPKEQNKP